MQSVVPLPLVESWQEIKQRQENTDYSPLIKEINGVGKK